MAESPWLHPFPPRRTSRAQSGIPSTSVPFDLPQYEALNAIRLAALDEVLSVLPREERGLTAADFGCGTGYFTEKLRERGFAPTASIFGSDAP